MPPHSDCSTSDTELCWTVPTVENAAELSERMRQRDIDYITKTVWGEARGLSEYEQAQVAWCVLNRVDSGRFPNTVKGVVTQPNQFYGYSENFPITDSINAVVEDVYDRWIAEKNGEEIERELAKEYCYFSGCGGHNHYRTQY